MPWPLEPTGLRAFARGLETLMVVEHKRPLLESQARAALYDLPAHAQPKVIGKVDEHGHPLLSQLGSLSVAEVALAIADRLPPGPHMERVHDFISRVSASGMAAVTLGAEQVRKPFFCSGCPHNTSTRLPEGSRALAGIGCHYMASFSDPATDLTSHMGGEGVTWAGASPFTSEDHVFANLGDGTYNHSGSLAIRASIAMGSHITYKLLYNDAVAMTGGQHPESGFSVAQITRQLAAEGVAKTVVVADEPERYAAGHRPRARRRGEAARRADGGAAGAARAARRHRADLRPDLRHREAPPAQARDDGPGAPARVHQSAGLRGLRRLLARLQLRLDRAAGDRVRPQAPDRPVDLQSGLFLPRRLLPLVRDAGGRRERPRPPPAGADRRLHAAADHPGVRGREEHHLHRHRRHRRHHHRLDPGHGRPRRRPGRLVGRHDRPGAEGRRGVQPRAHRRRPRRRRSAGACRPPAPMC